MVNIKNEWLKNESNCQPATAPPVPSSGLGTDSFLALFLIAGSASTLALLIFVASFIYRHRHVFTQPAPSPWTNIRTMFRIFNEKDPNCHAFKSSQPPGAEDYCPQSPVRNNSSHTDTNSVSSGEQQASSADQASPEIGPAATEVVLTIPLQAMQISTPSTAQEYN